MKKMLLLMVLIMTSLSFAKYEVNEKCDDISWTDNNGLETSIYAQNSDKKAVLIFWGGSS